MTETYYYDEDEARAARTQCLFRDANERVLNINDAFSVAVTQADWVCECANRGCSERISLTLEEYEAIRASPIRFTVAPGAEHFFANLERVVEKNERFWVVEKTGTAGDLAASVDPRRVRLRGVSYGS